MRKIVDFSILVLIFVCFSSIYYCSFAHAGETCTTKLVKEETPKQFKKSDVTRVLKDGTIQKFDGDKYKIVPRTQKRKVCKACKPKVVESVVTVKEKVFKRRRNHLQLLIGDGPDDELSVLSGNRIRSNGEPVVGIAYSRDMFRLNRKHSVSVGIFYLSNETVGGSIGVSW